MTVHKKSHHNNTRVRKKIAAEIENIEIDFDLD